MKKIRTKHPKGHKGPNQKMIKKSVGGKEVLLTSVRVETSKSYFLKIFHKDYLPLGGQNIKLISLWKLPCQIELLTRSTLKRFREVLERKSPWPFMPCASNVRCDPYLGTDRHDRALCIQEHKSHHMANRSLILIGEARKSKKKDIALTTGDDLQGPLIRGRLNRLKAHLDVESYGHFLWLLSTFGRWNALSRNAPLGSVAFGQTLLGTTLGPGQSLEVIQTQLVKLLTYGHMTIRQAPIRTLNFHYDVIILCKPYLKLQTSKLDNLGGSRKKRQQYTTSLFLAELILIVYSVKSSREVVASPSTLLGLSLYILANFGTL
ncbi:hypothetical protein CR513_24870, partial [Mucuna pruriens]